MFYIYFKNLEPHAINIKHISRMSIEDGSYIIVMNNGVIYPLSEDNYNRIMKMIVDNSNLNVQLFPSEDVR